MEQYRVSPHGGLKVIGQSLLVLVLAVALAAIIVAFSSTPVVYHSHKAYLQTGKRVCVFVETADGRQPCSVLEKEKITTYESHWAE